MDYRLGTIEASEALIKDLYINLTESSGYVLYQRSANCGPWAKSILMSVLGWPEKS